MNANDYKRGYMPVVVDELADQIDSGELNERIKALDSHWTEVMKLAEKYGFISQAYGGVAVITTNSVYLEANSAKSLAKRLRMNNVELG